MEEKILYLEEHIQKAAANQGKITQLSSLLEQVCSGPSFSFLSKPTTKTEKRKQKQTKAFGQSRYFGKKNCQRKGCQ